MTYACKPCDCIHANLPWSTQSNSWTHEGSKILAKNHSVREGSYFLRFLVPSRTHLAVKGLCRTPGALPGNRYCRQQRKRDNRHIKAGFPFQNIRITAFLAHPSGYLFMSAIQSTTQGASQEQKMKQLLTPCIQGLLDTAVPAAKRASNESINTHRCDEQEKLCQTADMRGPDSSALLANDTCPDGADFPHIQKKDFWTLTANVQQMHERLGEYHHLVTQREKKKQYSGS